MALRTDYKNAIFSGKRKYHLIENEDGTVSLLDATQYSQTGDRFGAKDVNDMGTAVNGLADSIGDAFSEEKTYAAGEYAIYDNALYEFTAAKAAGPWDPDVAALTTIADALSELNGNLKLLMPNYANAETITLPYTAQTNGYIYGQGHSEGGLCRLTIDNTLVYSDKSFSGDAYSIRTSFLVPIAEGQTARNTSESAGSIGSLKFVPFFNNNV